MSNRGNKLILEDTLNQIYSNNYFFDSDIKSFFFHNVKFIIVNDLRIYTPRESCIEVTLFQEDMVIKVATIPLSIYYASIKEFSIYFED